MAKRKIPNLIGADLYLCITTNDGKQSYDRRRVWDGTLFMSSLRKQLAKDGATVAEVTRDEYLASRKR